MKKTNQIDDAAEPDLLVVCRAWLAGGQAKLVTEERNLATAAARHGLLGIVHRGGLGLSDDLRRTARRAYEEQAATALLARLQLEELGAAFAEKGIPLIALKGAAAALSLYADPPCRRLRDLDLLTPENCIPAARAIMKSLGYTPVRNRSSREEEDALLPLTHLQPYRRAGRLPVEIHTSLLQGRSPHREGLVSTDVLREAAPLATVTGLLRPSPRHFALHTALHYTKDLDEGFAELKGLLDVVLTLRTSDLASLRKVARRWEVEVELDRVLSTLHRHFGVGEPREPAPLSAAQLLDGVPQRTNERYRAMLSAAHRVPGAGARARYLLRLVVPTPDKLRHQYRLAEGEPLGRHYARHVLGVAGRFLRSLRRPMDV